MFSIDPKLWGPSAWILLHDISFYIAHSKDDNIMYKAQQFFKTLRYILPCTKCQYAYDIHLLYIPFPSEQSKFPKWVFKLHNRVNDTLDRHIVKPTWELWSTKYHNEMMEHRLKDIWPFIQSIVEIHPGRNDKESNMYKDNLRIFFRYLWEFLYNMNTYHNDKDILDKLVQINDNDYDKIIESKVALRKWITSIGKTIHSKQFITQCDITCNA